MSSQTDALVALYRKLTGHRPQNGVEHLPQISPILPAGPGCLWARITPNVHNPNGRFIRSASLCVFDPARGSVPGTATYVELQAFDGAGEGADGINRFDFPQADRERLGDLESAIESCGIRRPSCVPA